MKTAIAVPDAVFARVEARVHSLGWSRSEFFARAAERYLNQLDREDLTARLDAAITANPAAAAEQAEWAQFGAASLAPDAGEEW
jgi:hypothetical protein